MLICSVLVLAGAVSVVTKLLVVYRSASYASRPARRARQAGLIDWSRACLHSASVAVHNES